MEHLLVLMTALALHENWALRRCHRCDAFVIGDPLSLPSRVCGECADTGRSSEAIAPATMDAPPIPEPSQSGYQHNLF